MKAMKHPIPRSMKCYSNKTTSTDGKTRSKSFFLHTFWKSFKELFEKTNRQFRFQIALSSKHIIVTSQLCGWQFQLAGWALGRYLGVGGTRATARVVQVVEVVIIVLDVNVDFLVIIEWRHRPAGRRWCSQAVQLVSILMVLKSAKD